MNGQPGQPLAEPRPVPSLEIHPSVVNIAINGKSRSIELERLLQNANHRDILQFVALLQGEKQINIMVGIFNEIRTLNEKLTTQAEPDPEAMKAHFEQMTDFFQSVLPNFQPGAPPPAEPPSGEPTQ